MPDSVLAASWSDPEAPHRSTVSPEVSERLRGLRGADDVERLRSAVEEEERQPGDASRQVVDLALSDALRGVDARAPAPPELARMLSHVLDRRGQEPRAVEEKTVGTLANATLTAFNGASHSGTRATLLAGPDEPALGGAAHHIDRLLPTASARLEASPLFHEAFAVLFSSGGWEGRFVRVRVPGGQTRDLPAPSAGGFSLGNSAMVIEAGPGAIAWDFEDSTGPIVEVLRKAITDAAAAEGKDISVLGDPTFTFGVYPAPAPLYFYPCLKLTVRLRVKVAPLPDLEPELIVYISAAAWAGMPRLTLRAMELYVPPHLLDALARRELEQVIRPDGPAWRSAKAAVREASKPLALFGGMRQVSVTPLILGTRATGSGGDTARGAQLFMAR